MICNSKGNFIQAYSRRLGNCHVLESELYMGHLVWYMRMALDNGIQLLRVESDSVDVVNEINEALVQDGQFHGWVMRFAKSKMSCFAKHGLSLSRDCLFFASIPNFALH